MSEGSAFAGVSFGYNSDAVFKYRDEKMCSKWNNCVDNNFLMCHVEAITNQNGNYVFKGNIKSYLGALANIQDVYIQYWAPNKPTRGYSFNGSGLPFANEEMAYQDTDNKGVAKVAGGQFIFNLDYPNSYYTQMGRKLNPPQVKFRFCDSKGKSMSKVYTVPLGHSIPFRSLNETKKRDWSKGPLFYSNPDMPPCRTQFQILVDSRYPDQTMKEPANFWGTKPPK